MTQSLKLKKLKKPLGIIVLSLIGTLIGVYLYDTYYNPFQRYFSVPPKTEAPVEVLTEYIEINASQDMNHSYKLRRDMDNILNLTLRYISPDENSSTYVGPFVSSEGFV